MANWLNLIWFGRGQCLRRGQDAEASLPDDRARTTTNQDVRAKGPASRSFSISDDRHSDQIKVAHNVRLDTSPTPCVHNSESLREPS